MKTGITINDIRHGFGTCKFSDGSVYAGNWQLGYKNGLGTFTWGTDQTQYIGQWVKNLKHGKGCLKT